MSGEESKGGFSIKNSSLQSISRIVQFSNMINGALLLLCGIMTFILESLSFLTVMAAIYVIFFALLMLTFEARFKCFDSAFFNQFGFMFNPYGRLCFFVFCGTLGIALGIFGYIAGGYTFVNACFNIYVMCVHPQYLQHLREEEKAKRAHGAKKSAAVTAAVAAATAASPVAGSVAVQMNAPATKPPTASEDEDPFGTASGTDSWEKLWDEHTQRHYYHNHATGETRWDKPN